MNEVLQRWNGLPAEEAASAILPCCGSKVWACRLAARRPLLDQDAVLAASDETWQNLDEHAWMEAFETHPRIGEDHPPSATSQSAAWSAEEQKQVSSAADSTKLALAEGNREYEERFGRVFIVCAAGRSAAEMLGILRRRLTNDVESELRESAEQQRQITHIRLKKWLQP